MKISATLKGIKDSLGRRTVYIRIVQNGQRKFYATGIKVEPKYWDKKVIGHLNAKRLNDQIRDLIIKYEANDLTVYSNISFNAYATQCLSDWENSKRPGTLKGMRSRLKKFREFYQGKIALTNDVLTKYVNYLYSIGNSTNTVWAALKTIRLIIYKAHREKLIKENPFAIFEMPKYRDPQRSFLTRQEVEQIESKLPKLGEYQFAAAWFLISCYTGLRYSDQNAFSKSKIKGGRLIIYTTKTGNLVSIPMNDKLKELFKLIEYRPMHYENQHYNRLLKAIGVECEIKQPLTAHLGRHTFGTLCASAGISQEVTAKLMGHQSIRTTAIYYSLTSERIDGEFSKLF